MRFSPAAVARTIRNRRAVARYTAALFDGETVRQRARDAVEVLDEAFKAMASVDSKRAALVALGKLARPNLPAGGHEALALLRTAVSTGALDRENEVVTIPEAAVKVRALKAEAEKAGVASDVSRAAKALGLLVGLESSGSGEVNFRSFWRDVEHLGVVR